VFRVPDAWFVFPDGLIFRFQLPFHVECVHLYFSTPHAPTFTILFLIKCISRGVFCRCHRVFVFFQTNLPQPCDRAVICGISQSSAVCRSVRKRALATQLVMSVLSSTGPLLGLCRHETVLELPAPVLEKALKSLVEPRI